MNFGGRRFIRRNDGWTQIFVGSGNQQGPRKRQRVEEVNEGVSEADWDEFERELRAFDIQHVQGRGKFAFAFVEGPLVKALRSGDWYAPTTPIWSRFTF